MAAMPDLPVMMHITPPVRAQMNAFDYRAACPPSKEGAVKKCKNGGVGGRDVRFGEKHERRDMCAGIKGVIGMITLSPPALVRKINAAILSDDEAPKEGAMIWQRKASCQ